MAKARGAARAGASAKGRGSARRGARPRAGPTREPKSGSASPPSARDVAVDALVEAATRLFATAGPDGVALRTIASEAGVNYGLIHQYVGSKDDLLRLVIRSVSERAAEAFTQAPDLESALAGLFGEAPSDYVAMLAWALLQDRDASELLGRSPALAALADRAVGRGREDRVARLAAVTAMALGWQLFGRFVSAGVGQPDASALTPRLRSLARELLSS